MEPDFGTVGEQLVRYFNGLLGKYRGLHPEPLRPVQWSLTQEDQLFLREFFAHIEEYAQANAPTLEALALVCERFLSRYLGPSVSYSLVTELLRLLARSKLDYFIQRFEAGHWGSDVVLCVIGDSAALQPLLHRFINPHDRLSLSDGFHLHLSRFFHSLDRPQDVPRLIRILADLEPLSILQRLFRPSQHSTVQLVHLLTVHALKKITGLTYKRREDWLVWWKRSGPAVAAASYGLITLPSGTDRYGEYERNGESGSREPRRQRPADGMGGLKACALCDSPVESGQLACPRCGAGTFVTRSEVSTGTLLRCSACHRQLEYIGDPRRSMPHASVLGQDATLRAMEQWRGLVCVPCKRVYCVDCVGYDGLQPRPCPACGSEPVPATRLYLTQAGVL